MIKGMVSVIIPTYGDMVVKGSRMDRALMSVALSTYKNIEIICVDENKERSVQRNTGLACARGEYVCYLDDDQYISRELIEECVDLMESGYDALYIPEIIVTNNWFGRLRNWERKFYTGTAVDCVRFFRAEGVPRFDTTMSGPEDADFDHKVKGHREVTHNVLYHDDDVGVIKYLKKKAYYCKSMETYRRRWPQDKVLSFWYRCFGVFTENGKWKWLIQKPHFTFMLMVIIFLRGVLYICRKR